ncbi:MAG: hypothetical protein Q9166_007909 [cf. Caloplaca sp. 2 TL-2023]
MADLDIGQAVRNITTLGRTPTPPSQEPQSTQYSGAFTDSDIVRPYLHPITPTQMKSLLGHTATKHTEAASIDHSPPADGLQLMPIPDSQPGPMGKLFSIARPVDEILTSEFTFSKAIPPTFNTKPTRGPAATLLQMKIGCETTESAAPTKVKSSISSTTVNIAGSSQLEQRQQHSENSKATPDRDETSKPSQPSSQAKTDTESASTDGQQDRALPVPYDALLSGKTAEGATVTTVAAAENVLDEHPQAAQELNAVGSAKTPGSHHDGDTPMLEGPTLINEAPAWRAISQTSSRSSTPSPSPSPSQGRSMKRHGVANSSHSMQPGRSALSKPMAARMMRKRRSRPGEGLPASRDTSRLSSTDRLPVDPEDALKALLIHHQRQKQQDDQIRAKEKAKDAEIEDLEIIIKNLASQIQESEERVTNKEAELLKYHRLASRWQDKAKNLSDFVNGLNNDHARLRNDAHAMRLEQQKILAHKENLNKLLQDTFEALEDERAQHKDRLLKAQHQTEMLEQALNARSLDLLGESERLRTEQGRSANLQDLLTRLATNNEEIRVKLTDQEATISSKITDLGKTIAGSLHDTPIRGQEYLEPKLEECLLLLKKPQPHDSIGAQHVRQLDVSIKENGDKIAQLASLCQESINATSLLENKLTSEFDTRFGKLVSSIETGRPLEQQIKDLREVKATIMERIKAAEEGLAESRHKVIAAETQEKFQLQKIAALEAEVSSLRNRPQESPLLAVRLHDKEKQCEQLDQQLSMYQLQLEDAKSKLETEYAEKSVLNESLQIAKADMEGLQAKFETITLEKVAVESQAVLNEDRLREELSDACKKEVSRNANKYLNEIQGLRHDLSMAEKRAEAGKTTISQLQAEKEEVVTNAEAARESLRKIQTSTSENSQMLEENRQENCRLKEAVEDMLHQQTENEKELHEKEKEILELREGLSQQQAEKFIVLEDARKAKTSANELQEQLNETLHASAQTERKLGDLKDKEAMQLLESREELRKLREDQSFKSGVVQNLRSLLSNTEAENNSLREQNNACKNQLATVNQKLKAQEQRVTKLLRERTIAAKPRPVSGGDALRSAKSNRLPEKKAVAFEKRDSEKPYQRLTPTKGVVVEDSQDRHGIIEEPQNQGPDSLPQQQPPVSPDNQLITNPLSFMPKAVQDLMAAPSSPMADSQTTSQAAIDCREMFPPSPVANQSRRVVEDSQASGILSQELGSDIRAISPGDHGRSIQTDNLPSQEPGNNSEDPSQPVVWALSESTTKTKTHSVTSNKSVLRVRQPVAGRTQPSGITSRQSPMSTSTGPQSIQQPGCILKAGGLKRINVSQLQSRDSPGTNKRRKLSAELGPTQATPAKSAGTSRRKSTLRVSQRGDKYHDRFVAELEKA